MKISWYANISCFEFVVQKGNLTLLVDHFVIPSLFIFISFVIDTGSDVTLMESSNYQ